MTVVSSHRPDSSAKPIGSRATGSSAVMLPMSDTYLPLRPAEIVPCKGLGRVNGGRRQHVVQPHDLRQRGIQLDCFAVTADRNAATGNFNLGPGRPSSGSSRRWPGSGQFPGNHQHNHAGANHDTHQRQRGYGLCGVKISRRKTDLIRYLHRCPHPKQPGLGLLAFAQHHDHDNSHQHPHRLRSEPSPKPACRSAGVRPY